jgi:hypothetical protein
MNHCCPSVAVKGKRLIVFPRLSIPKDPATGALEAAIEATGFMAGVYDSCILLSTRRSAVRTQTALRNVRIQPPLAASTAPEPGTALMSITSVL